MDDVDGSDSVSGRDDNVESEEISVGSVNRLGSPWVYECVAHYSSRSVESGGGG